MLIFRNAQHVRYLNTALLCALAIWVAVSAAHAQTRLDQPLPGLNAFLDDRYPGVRANRTPLEVVSADLDEPADGIEEVIVGFAGILFCGPSGCLMSILRRESNGQLVEIARRITRELEFRTGFVSGGQALADDIRRNPGRWKISGLTSGEVR